MNTPASKGTGAMSLDDFNAIFAPDSTANLEEKIDVEALFEKIKASTSSILEEKFRDNPEKQDIVNRNNRINFACPSCGDSKWNKSKKRGNIYYSRGNRIQNRISIFIDFEYNCRPRNCKDTVT